MKNNQSTHQKMHDTMKAKVDSAVERGGVSDEHITGELGSQAFSKWTIGFSRQEHPTIIQVKDIKGHCLPNLVYVSRERNKTTPHHFKSGALNALLRVSATLTNAPVILTQDCDVFSNGPRTPLSALCYLLGPIQRYHGINKNDTYANELKILYQVNPMGMDGLSGPKYVGSGCFFPRRAFFGSPSAQLSAEIAELDPNHIIDTSIPSKFKLDLAYRVANCEFENGTKWGLQMGFRYGSLVEDYYTGFRQKCEGWKAVFYNPDRPAFLGDFPITLNDSLSQVWRWDVGLLEVGFSKYSPIIYGTKYMNLLMGLSYAHNASSPFLGFPMIIYALLPSLALLNQVYLFPKISSPLGYLYIFLFLGAYGQDCLEFISEGSTFRQWHSDQRMWMIRGVSSHLFSLLDFLLQTLGVTQFGFNVTSKVVDGEQSKRYEQGLFEFGVASPLFVPLTTAALINLISLVVGVSEIYKHGSWDETFLQLCLSGFTVLNSWPIYEAIVWRTDNGKKAQIVTSISMILTLAFYLTSSLTFRN